MKSKTLVNELVPTLYEDDFLLAVAKPSGLDVGGLKNQSTGGLLDILTEVRGCRDQLQPANRLSRYESGVLLLGKEPGIVNHIRTGLKAMRIAQEYVAVVLGRMSRPRISVNTGRNTPQGKGRRQKPQRGHPLESGPSDLRTTLSLINQGERRALIRCRTNVQNTHVLKAQLRSVRLRLLGDRLRDSSHRPKPPELTCLHLARVAFYHPALKSKITVTSQPPEAFKTIVEGERDVERLLHAALTRRLTCLVDPDTDSYRLLTGSVEGMKGLVAERYGPVVILQVLEELPALTGSLLPIARWYRNVLGVRAVYVKRFVKDRADDVADVATELRSPRPLLGERVPEHVEIQERGCKFVIRPYGGFSVGLFLDHRENRSRVRSMAGGRDVLNLFAYTCSFSVAAAVGGARSTVSVDVSPRHLEWGRDNFELNGLDLTDHQFITSDAFEYLKRAGRRDEQFDLILLDPPSFSHGRKSKRDFSIARDLADLIAGSVAVLRSGGVLMISTNYRRLSLGGLGDRLKRGAGRRRFKVIEAPTLPVDFAMDPNHAKTIFVRFE